MIDPDTLSWDNSPARKPWSEQLLISVAAAIPLLEQADADAFVAGYSGLAAPLRIKYWSELLVAIAWFESGWDPNNIYPEGPPLNVDSIGLLQLSYEDQQSYHLKEPLDPAKKSLRDPSINLRCGVDIFSHLLSRDKVVASQDGGKYKGAARYWSTIRQQEHLAEIQARVKAALGL